MSEPRRLSIMNAIVERLSAISRAQGEYRTDAGDDVFKGEAPQLGDDDPDQAISLMWGDDEPRVAGPGYLVSAPLMVSAVAKVTLAEPWDVIELVLADIKKAVELDDDRRLEGLLSGVFTRGATATLAREPGSLVVGLTIRYDMQWKESWGGL